MSFSMTVMMVGVSVAMMATGFGMAGGGTIPGYNKGKPQVARAPISLAELELLKKTVLFTDDDVRYLKMSAAVLEDQIDEILDVWYGFVGSNEHLLASFVDVTTKQPDGDYLAAVRLRFGQWIRDTAAADYDQSWLDWQIEIGRRHHRTGKNKTDGANAASQVSFRYLQALTVPITTTLKPFLAKKGHTTEEVERMHAAWVKSVTMQTILWSYPYVRDGEF